MKWKFLIVGLIFSCTALHGQPLHTSNSPFSNVASFAEYAYQKFNNDLDRFSFVYDWICSNVNYDSDSALYFNWSAPYDTKIESTLRRKKGVCENYASLLADVSRRMQIPAYVIHGFPTIQISKVDDSHAWVAVKMNNDWLLCDPTWDATGSDKRKYFLADPQRFIDSHIPFDPMWQLLEKPLYYKSNARYNYKDSISAFLLLDSLQQLLSTQERIRQSGVRNTMINNWQRMNNMNIAIIAGERDEQIYNEAVRSYNNALSCYNKFISFRNNQFNPTMSDAALSKLLSPVATHIKEAKEKIKELGSIRDNFQYDPSELVFRIEQLQQKTAVQEKFLAVYLKTDGPSRIKLLHSN